ncbi:MAG: serine protease [Acidobacteria bacterium]|nr:serine protease [Acidobacteriota bacterium]
MRGTGFLIDSGGLILTSASVASARHYLAVTIAPGKTVPAVVVRRLRSRWIATIRVNPETVEGLVPLPLAPKPEAPEARDGADTGGMIRQPAVGDRVVGLHGTLDGVPKMNFGTIRKVRGGTIIADFPLRANSAGGPVLDLHGRVIAVNPKRVSRRKDKGMRALRSHKIERLLKVSRATMHLMDTPSSTPFTPLPPGTFPLEALRSMAASEYELGDYQVQAGPYLVEFLTPPLMHALHQTARAQKGSNSKRSRDTCRNPKGEVNRWRPAHYTTSPVVTLQVIPEIRRNSAKYAAVVAYWVFYPVILLVALFGGGPELLADPPSPTSCFVPAFDQVELLRGGRVIQPIHPGRRCGQPFGLLEIDFCSEGSGRTKKRKVKGCFGIFTYPAEAFVPGEPMEVRITKKSRRSEPEVVPLDPDLIERISSDFQPYFDSVDRVGQ